MSVVMLKDRAAAFEAIDGVEEGGFRDAVLRGLALPHKMIPSRFFYDERGSALFEDITRLEAYYPTRSEMAIFEGHGADIAAHLPETRALVEFGSGSSLKIRAMLKAMPQLTHYAPIDISGEMLTREAQALSADFPDLEVVPIHADFMSPVELPKELREIGKLAFFPGSTIGNLEPYEALEFLARVRDTVGTGGHLLIGVDRKKDTETLVRAYDDPEGVTAAFNLNLLARANRELEADFDLSGFAHEARYNADRGRIEMHLKSLKEQAVSIGACRFDFTEGETIHTENSYKYAPDEFRLLARAARFEPVATWTDANERFAVYLLQSEG
ncbi:L-histidine N(alpha)-methyltransferase [Stappia sp. GBMRC 2046]|uniref:L-histidine N(Alpha)-methyltransferase n=1 Tax=Stappia sediminis TaxID=2692190 RepID=A0A7X3S8H7_9HYPH|nr:L-histidine N(alpha)-methyltransferase [Stappia sediminis]MXN65775.1 L-histidine N(alpha)-methyltransferase [Stappia sediminis]